MSAKKLTQDTPATVANGSATPVITAPVLSQSTDLDPNQFRIGQDYAAFLGVKKTAVVAAVRKPGDQHWIQVHPDRAWRIQVAVLEDKVNQRTYLVVEDLIPEVIGDLIPKVLVAYISRQGNVNLWPIRMPDESGRLDSWNESALAIVERYSGRWIRVLRNKTDGCYDIQDAPIELPPPNWPEGGFRPLFNLAFRNRVIDRIDHSVLKALRGEIL